MHLTKLKHYHLYNKNSQQQCTKLITVLKHQATLLHIIYSSLQVILSCKFSLFTYKH